MELIPLLLPPPLGGGVALDCGLEVVCALAAGQELAVDLAVVVRLTIVVKPDICEEVESLGTDPDPDGLACVV